MHTEDSVFYQHGNGLPAVGRERVREVIAELFAQVPDLRFENRRAYAGDGHLVSEYEVSGTVDGRSFACDGVDVFLLRDGLIARKDSYIDYLSVQEAGIDLAAAAPRT